ncbi:TetR/AcrR family transcriptional regulator [Yinghuangia soli]|uniref:TetR/AcrR family transcriptional regulator n=1 Tax=Yinghuangia soli TaxID=2908204 RepID=A0AA41PYN3_9ACTN|nr:TetR family transcriptional regulator [Yinghuangia soli]MCF2528183.1 TetR/AcrR family transcriptional regulator [Yinghuangia soli]
MNSEGGGRRRQQYVRPADRRSQILGHACVLFARQGYGGTTVRQIADAAQLLSGSLYHHFPSKEAMLLEIMEEFFAETLARHRASLAGTRDPVVALRGLIRNSLTVIAENPDASLVVVGECRRLAQTERFRWLAEQTAQTSAMWQGVMADGVRAGVLRPDLRPETTARLVQTGVWAMAQWYRSGGRYDPDEAADVLVDLFVRGIARPEAYRSRSLGEILGPARAAGAAVGVDPGRYGTLAARMALVPDGADARMRIGYAAGLLFAQQGYAVTTVRQIAELADVPLGSLAHHIGSKERLLAEMLTGFFQELLTAFDKDAVAAPGPLERVEGLIASTVEVLAGHGVAAVILLNERSAEDVPRAELNSLLGSVEGIWTRAIADGIGAGRFRADLDPAFVQRVVRTAISTSSGGFRGIGVRDVAGLYQEIALAGIGARRS